MDTLKSQAVPEAVIKAMEARNSPLTAEGQSAAAKAAQSNSSPSTPGATTKKAGVTRIGIVIPKINLGQAGQNPVDAEALRGLLAHYLSGPATDVVSISALLPDQITAEAQAKQCDYLIYDSFTYKKSGSALGLLKNAHTVLGMIPMVGGVAAAAGTLATVASSTAQEGALSSAVTAKSQLTLDYRLSPSGSQTPALSNSLTERAGSDGQDIITPLIEQEATVIMAQLTEETAIASMGKSLRPEARI